MANHITPQNEYLEKLIRHYQQAILIYPNYENIQYQLAELYYEYGDLEKTLRICQKILQVLPHSSSADKIFIKILTRLGFRNNEIISIRELLIENIKFKELLLFFVEVVEVPDNSDLYIQGKTWRDYHYLSYQAIQDKDYRRALEFCNKAIQLEPSLPFSHMIIKYFLLPKIKPLDGLLHLYQNIVKLPNIHRLSHTILGNLLAENGQINEAIKTYQNAWRSPHYFSSKTIIQKDRSTIDYLVIGIGKAGTTSLYSYLSQHPQIINPLDKEIHFFSEKFHYGFDWYMAQFPHLAIKSSHFITGETNPWYLTQVDVPKRVLEALPNVKLITILRNPASRAISHFYMAQKLGLERRSLEEAINSEIEILRNVEDPREVSEEYWKTDRGYLYFSFYLPFLKQWLSLFPREQFLILDSESFYHETDRVLDEVFGFLGLENFELPNYYKSNQGSYPKEKNEASYCILSDFFSEHNQKLEIYLGRSFHWDKNR